MTDNTSSDQYVDPEEKPVEELSDEELEQELTVAAHDPVRRHDRYEALYKEWLIRHRGYSGRTS